MITASGRRRMPASFRCCFSSESPSQARISHSKRRSGTASWSCQATIWPTDNQGRYGSPSALEPPSTRIRYSSGGDGSNVIGKRRQPVHPAAPGRRAELQDEQRQQARQAGRQAAEHPATGPPAVPPPRPRRQVHHERRPDHSGQASVPYPISTPRSAASTIPRRHAGRHHGNPAGQHHRQRGRQGDRHRHRGQPDRRGDPPRSRPCGDRLVAGRRRLGSQSSLGSWVSHPGGAEDGLARELQAGEQPRLIDGRRLDRALDPPVPHASHHDHHLLAAVDDPVFLHAEPQVFLGLLLVVALPRAGGDDLDDDLGKPRRQRFWRCRSDGGSVR